MSVGLCPISLAVYLLYLAVLPTAPTICTSYMFVISHLGYSRIKRSIYVTETYEFRVGLLSGCSLRSGFRYRISNVGLSIHKYHMYNSIVPLKFSVVLRWIFENVPHPLKMRHQYNAVDSTCGSVCTIKSVRRRRSGRVSTARLDKFSSSPVVRSRRMISIYSSRSPRNEAFSLHAHSGMFTGPSWPSWACF